jgi:hypothetical protein
VTRRNALQLQAQVLHGICGNKMYAGQQAGVISKHDYWSMRPDPFFFVLVGDWRGSVGAVV